ncbi:hypothetical protein SAMN06297144_1334 [Sphingomonas guangdongensis]|uniref:Outer membrane protein beta-barrel domain-containing protein n=1 Tax=Sphingomonas guangdongensis TaxID=1141890 RepID=A0A285QLL4_9SPHN|nr:hypothetical protein [Sphingomonas guangdongensis]SOB80982.1 hypothetical protein SAMN06297144_1334 [Sphingomonas guangdongensis]
MKIYAALMVPAFLALATPALAQDASADDGAVITAAVTAGTLGIGPDVGVRFSDNLGIRANANFLSVGADFDSDDIEYDGDLKLRSFGAMIDVYPFGGAFRISGGARINKNRAEVRATPTGTFELGDATYTQAQVGTLSGRAEVKDFAPALTLGWAGSKRRGFFFMTEGGVLFQGTVRIREFTATGTAANNATFRADLERERQSLQDDVDKVKVYPILQFGIGYRF